MTLSRSTILKYVQTGNAAALSRPSIARATKTVLQTTLTIHCISKGSTPPPKNSASIGNVLVVFCAKPDNGPNVIVGWYKNATVYRRRPSYMGRDYNIEADKNDCFLLPEKERRFHVPRAKKDGFGFGQANIWYAQEAGCADYITAVLKYIDAHSVRQDKPQKAINAKSTEVMKCAICGTERCGNFCPNCGYDASCDFVSNRTVSRVPEFDAAQRKFAYLYHKENKKQPPEPLKPVTKAPPKEPTKPVTQAPPIAPPTVAEEEKRENKRKKRKPLVTIFAVIVQIFALHVMYGSLNSTAFVTCVLSVILAIAAIISFARTTRRNVFQESLSREEQEFAKKEPLIISFAAFVLIFTAVAFPYVINPPRVLAPWRLWGSEWWEMISVGAVLAAIFATAIIIYNTCTTLRRWSKQRQMTGN